MLYVSFEHLAGVKLYLIPTSSSDIKAKDFGRGTKEVNVVFDLASLSCWGLLGFHGCRLSSQLLGSWSGAQVCCGLVWLIFYLWFFSSWPSTTLILSSLSSAIPTSLAFPKDDLFLAAFINCLYLSSWLLRHSTFSFTSWHSITTSTHSSTLLTATRPSWA